MLYTVRQLAACIAAWFNMIAFGATLGYSAILLPQLELYDEDDKFYVHAKSETASWIAAMAALPMIFGSFISGFFMDLVGRKWSFIWCSIPGGLGWLAICYSQETYMILIGRFVTGFVGGVISPICNVYCGEVTTKELRPFMLASMATSIALGITVFQLMGTYCDWRYVALGGACICGVALIGTLLCPQTPCYLIFKQNFSKAEQIHYYLFGRSEETEKAFQQLMDHTKHKQKVPLRHLRSALKEPTFYKPILIMMLLFGNMQVSGVNAIAFYTVTIIQDAVGGKMNPYLILNLMNGVRMVSSVLFCCVVNLIGRRPLAIGGNIGGFFSLGVLALFCYFKINYKDIENYPEIPLVCLITYTIFGQLAIIPLPWSMLGELFPMETKALGSSLSSCFCYLVFFGVVKITPFILRTLDTYGLFGLGALVLFIGTILFCFFLPETRGKTLEQIENEFKS